MRDKACFLALPGHGLVASRARPTSPSTSLLPARYEHSSGICTSRRPVRIKQVFCLCGYPSSRSSRAWRLPRLLARHVLEFGRCRRVLNFARVVAVTTPELLQIAASHQKLSNHHFSCPSLVRIARKRQHADDTCLIDRLSRPSLNSFF